MTTTPLTERDAQLKEAARDLLQLSKTLNQDQTLGGEELMPGHHIIHAATALAVLATGDVSTWSDFTALVREVAAEEGSN